MIVLVLMISKPLPEAQHTHGIETVIGNWLHQVASFRKVPNLPPYFRHYSNTLSATCIGNTVDHQVVPPELITNLSARSHHLHCHIMSLLGILGRVKAKVHLLQTSRPIDWTWYVCPIKRLIFAGGADTKRGANQETGDTRLSKIWS